MEIAASLSEAAISMRPDAAISKPIIWVHVSFNCAQVQKLTSRLA